MERFVLPDMDKEYSITKTLRLKNSLVEKLEFIANSNNMSVNRLVVECIEFALNNLEEVEKQKNKKEKIAV